MPRALERVPKAEVKSSPALSLTALPGDGGIKTRKVAILVADGIAAEPVRAVLGALTDAGAVSRLLGSRLGTIRSADGEEFEIDATLENSPSVLFDAVVLPDGEAAVQVLAKDGHTLEFVKDQYRHGKTILVLGAAARLLDQVGIPKELPTGKPDPGVIVDADAFIAAVAKHRHPERDQDPPLI